MVSWNTAMYRFQTQNRNIFKLKKTKNKTHLIYNHNNKSNPKFYFLTPVFFWTMIDACALVKQNKTKQKQSHHLVNSHHMGDEGR